MYVTLFFFIIFSCFLKTKQQTFTGHQLTYRACRRLAFRACRRLAFRACRRLAHRACRRLAHRVCRRLAFRAYNIHPYKQTQCRIEQNLYIRHEHTKKDPTHSNNCLLSG